MHANASPVVLELFTSQSCSSCPEADALLKSLSEGDKGLLALSFHVDYWDYLNWKDTYSSPVNTQRQHVYAHLSGGEVFTPQLIIDGAVSKIGSDDTGITQAIMEEKRESAAANVSIAPADGKLAVTITPVSKIPEGSEIWEVRYDRYAKTEVKAGENGGRTLESINNVTSLKWLESYKPGAHIMLDPLQGYGVAIIVQMPDQGRVLGAASYNK